MTTHSGSGHAGPDQGLSVIMSERRQLINLTYRLLGDIDALISLLDPGATVVADGGGLAGAQPIEGREQIARACVDLTDRAPGLTILERTVNGQPGLITQQDGVTAAVLAFDVAGDRIKHIWAVLNPQKLRPWTTA
jgi:hypothetical protein